MNIPKIYFLFIPSTDDTFSGTNISSVAAEGACSLALMTHAVFLALQNSKLVPEGLAKRSKMLTLRLITCTTMQNKSGPDVIKLFHAQLN